MSPPLPITEDTPPDMLAGAMDLHVILPNGQDIKMSVERSTPMMDLLVQVTTANKISPGGHVIQAIGDRGILPYKPSTPIGALDTWTIHIVSKKQAGNMYARKPLPRPVNQSTPFEQTFRLQVNLPRNQLYVSRVSYKVRLEDVLREVCKEKNLDQSKYCFIHPEKLDEELDLSKTFLDYKLQQVTLTSRSNRPVGLSSADIMALKRYDNGSQHVNNQYYASHSYDGSISSGSMEGRSLSPVRSDESSSSPTIPKTTTILGRPVRKRRPAPKPPSVQNERNSKHVTTTENLTISHSRNSSDSSGYHESSVLSESPESNSNSLANSLPRRSKLPSEDPHDNELTSHQRPRSSKYTNGKIGNNLSRSLSNLAVIGNKKAAGNMLLNGMKPKEYSTSSTSLASIPGKKKKAPAPPPPPSTRSLLSLKEEETLADVPSVTHVPNETLQKSQTLPVTARSSEGSASTSSSTQLSCHNSTSSKNDFASHTVDDSSHHNLNLPVDEVDSAIVQSVCSDNRPTKHIKSKDKELTMDDEEIDRIFSDATKDYESTPIVSATVPPPLASGTDNRTVNSHNDQVDDSHEWKYKLPSPPQAFRDQECDLPKSNNHHVVSTKNKDDFVKQRRLTVPEVGLADATVIANNLKNNECYNDRNQPKGSFGGETIVNGDGRETTKFRSSSVTKIGHQQEDLERAALISKEAVKAVVVSRTRTLQREQSTFDASSCDTYLSTNDSGLGSDDSIPSMSDGKCGLEETCYANGAKTRRTDIKMPERRNTLQNFTITTYQNSNSKPTEIFHDDSVKTAKTTQLAQDKHTYGKMSKENCTTATSAALSRHSSFSAEKLSNSMVKRSKSHISLLSGNFTKFNRLNKFNGTKEYAEEGAGSVSASSENLCYYEEESKSTNTCAISHLRRTASEDSVNKECIVKEEEEEEETKCTENEKRSTVLNTMKNVEEFQSVQLLKGILPQINRTPAQSTQNSTSTSTTTTKIASTVQPVTSTNGPTVMIRTRTSSDHQPAVNLQSWSERPKRQVSIKTDRDYVFGNHHHRLSACDSRDHDMAGEDYRDSSISNGDRHKEVADRVPVVRAVEFKKPFARQNNVSEGSKRPEDIIKPKQRPSSFYLFGEHSTTNGLHSPSEPNETFVNEIHNLKNASSSSSAAKRYSIGAISEVSNETSGNRVENYTFKTYKNKYGSSNNRRSENGGSTTTFVNGECNSAVEPSSCRTFNADSSKIGAAVVTTRPIGVPSAPAPPPLSYVRSTSNQRCGISQKIFANENPRDTLLASIKNFNRDNLKKSRA